MGTASNSGTGNINWEAYLNTTKTTCTIYCDGITTTRTGPTTIDIVVSGRVSFGATTGAQNLGRSCEAFVGNTRLDMNFNVGVANTTAAFSRPFAATKNNFAVSGTGAGTITIDVIAGYATNGTNTTRWYYEGGYINNYKLSTNVSYETYASTVKYNANGGSGTMADSTVEPNANFKTRQCTFTRSGYTFVGWNEKADGSGTWWNIPGYTAGTEDSSSTGSNGVYEANKNLKWTYTKDITLYAQWVGNKYTMTLNHGPGKNGTATSNSYTVQMGTSSYRSRSGIIPTLDGFKFDGWWTAASGGTQIYGADGIAVNDGTYWKNNLWNKASNATFYAHWVPVLDTFYLYKDSKWIWGKMYARTSSDWAFIIKAKKW